MPLAPLPGSLYATWSVLSGVGGTRPRRCPGSRSRHRCFPCSRSTLCRGRGKVGVRVAAGPSETASLTRRCAPEASLACSSAKAHVPRHPPGRRPRWSIPASRPHSRCWGSVPCVNADGVVARIANRVWNPRPVRGDVLPRVILDRHAPRDPLVSDPAALDAERVPFSLVAGTRDLCHRAHPNVSPPQATRSCPPPTAHAHRPPRLRHGHLQPMHGWSTCRVGGRPSV